MPVSFIHPDLMQEFSKWGSYSHFPNIITVQTVTTTYNSSTNEPTQTRTNDVTMSDLSAYIEPVSTTQEIRKANQTVVTNAWMISLAGFYDVSVGNAIIDELGNVYNVLDVDHDAYRTQTVLTCEIVNTTVETQ